MSQAWLLVNIDEKCSLYAKDMNKYSPGPHWLQGIQRCYCSSERQMVGSLPREHEAALLIETSTSGHLTRLPQELIDSVVEFVDEIRKNAGDLLALALTCGYFFRLLAPTVSQDLLCDSAPWAEDRLILVSSDVMLVPNGVASAAELKEWDEKLGMGSLYKTGEHNVVAGDDEFNRLEEAVIDVCRAFPSRAADKIEIYASGMADKERNSDIFCERRGALLRDIHRRLSAAAGVGDALRLKRLLAALTTPSGPLVLRNITTKEYVRDSVLREAGYHDYHLGGALCVQTLWTQSPSGMGGLPCEGAWAGHRFDIRALEAVEDEEWDDDQRDDVTATALHWLKVGCGDPANP